MTYGTEEKLKSYLDTNQLHREQMCRGILELDGRFSEVRPRHPRGGRDGGRDIQALYRNEQLAFGAVGFVNQANDSAEQKKTVKKKFRDDLASAIAADQKPLVFVFLTNIALTVTEKKNLVSAAQKKGLTYCDVFDRERLRIALDSADGFALRYQYLGIPLSEPEQATFFAKWGDNIQAVIATGFQSIEKSTNRILFLLESEHVLSSLVINFQLRKKFSAEDIGHFRAFCNIFLKEPKHGIFQILFGSSDKSDRMQSDGERQDERPGIKHGISRAQWENRISLKDADEADDEYTREFVQVGSGSSVGADEVEFVSLRYSHDHFIRFEPRLRLRDLDQAKFIFFLNKSLAEKVQAVHIYANGYKLQETQEIKVDGSEFEPTIPLKFDDSELRDPWVRIRPADVSSAFDFDFFGQTPKRLMEAEETPNSLPWGRKR